MTPSPIKEQKNPCLVTWESLKGHKTMSEGASHYCAKSKKEKHDYHVCPCGARKKRK